MVSSMVANMNWILPLPVFLSTSLPAFHLCGPWFKSHLRPGALHVNWVSYLIAWVFTIGIFLQHLKLSNFSCLLSILLLALFVLLDVSYNEQIYYTPLPTCILVETIVLSFVSTRTLWHNPVFRILIWRPILFNFLFFSLDSIKLWIWAHGNM